MLETSSLLEALKDTTETLRVLKTVYLYMQLYVLDTLLFDI